MSRKKRSRSGKKYVKKNSKNVSVKIILIILLIVFGMIILIQNKKDNTNNLINKYENKINELNISDEKETSSGDVKNDNTNNKSDVTINIAAIGDIMCHNTQYQDAYNTTTKNYDFSYVFDEVKYYIQTADLAIGNLETTFTGSNVGYSGYHTFNTPEELAQNLKDIGMDVLTTANNHSLDKGYKGIESTIKYLDAADIAHTGTFTSKEEQNNILIKNVKGIKIAFLSYTYGTNGIPVPSEKDYCINLIDKELIKEQLELAKAENPDLIFVSIHWGVEYQTKPNNEQKNLADFLFENGADVILGSHPHVLQPMEKRKITLEDGTTKDGFLIYSLGNFISGQNKANTKDLIILNLKITKNGKTDKITIDDYSYVPIYMYKASTGTQKYKLIDINRTIAAYESGEDKDTPHSVYTTLTTELKNIKKILGED